MGHERSPQKLFPLAWALELSGSPGTPDLITEGLSLWRFKRKHLKGKEGKGAPPPTQQTHSSPLMGPFPGELEQVAWLQSTAPASPHDAFKEPVASKSACHMLFSQIMAHPCRMGEGSYPTQSLGLILLQKG